MLFLIASICERWLVFQMIDSSLSEMIQVNSHLILPYKNAVLIYNIILIIFVYLQDQKVFAAMKTRSER